MTVLQAYNGKANDASFTFRPTFRLKPGENREIRGKWHETNIFRLVVKDLKTGKYRRTEGDWTDGDSLLASVRPADCHTRTDGDSTTVNPFDTREMTKGNWEPLKTLIGENRLTKLPAMRLKPGRRMGGIRAFR